MGSCAFAVTNPDGSVSLQLDPSNTNLGLCQFVIPSGSEAVSGQLLQLTPKQKIQRVHLDPDRRMPLLHNRETRDLDHLPTPHTLVSPVPLVVIKRRFDSVFRRTGGCPSFHRPHLAPLRALFLAV